MSVAILSLIIVLPVAAAIVWQRSSRAQWGSLILGFSAFAVNGLVRIPLTLEQVIAIPLIRWLLDFLPDILMRVPTAWIMYALTLALFREGIRWLILFFLATNVRTWKEGVMFGLGYSCLVAVDRLGGLVSQYSEEATLYQYTFVETITIVNDRTRWWEAVYLALDWSVAGTVFDVGTSLVVLFSVGRRNLWLFLAAVLWYVSFFELPRIVFFSIHYLEVVGIHSSFIEFTIPLLTRFLIALLPFWLLFDQRKVEDFSKMLPFDQRKVEFFNEIMTPNPVRGAAVLVGLAWILVILFMTLKGWFTYWRNG